MLLFAEVSRCGAAPRAASAFKSGIQRRLLHAVRCGFVQQGCLWRAANWPAPGALERKVQVVTDLADASDLKKSKANQGKLREQYITRLRGAGCSHRIAARRSEVSGQAGQSARRYIHRLQGAEAERHHRHRGRRANHCGAERRLQPISAPLRTASGITGLAGDLKTTGLNPLLNANSATQLAGPGSNGSRIRRFKPASPDR